MSQAVHSFRTAFEARELDDAVGLLTDDVIYRSPIAFEPYHGPDAVRGILTEVFCVFDDWRCVRAIGAPDCPDHAIVFQARIGDRQIEGCDFLHLDEKDSIDGFYVMVRPLSGALAVAGAVTPQLALAQEGHRA
jgi:SnoaL-like protein